jgi:hypothetical protein
MKNWKAGRWHCTAGIEGKMKKNHSCLASVVKKTMDRIGLCLMLLLVVMVLYVIVYIVGDISGALIQWAVDLCWGWGGGVWVQGDVTCAIGAVELIITIGLVVLYQWAKKNA